MTAQPVIEADQMPTWLNNPPAAPGAAQRWGQRLMFAGVALLTIAVTAGATLLGLDLYESHSSMAVVAAHSPAAEPGPTVQPVARPGADVAPLVEKRASSLPPLVMLAPDPHAAPKKDDGAVAPAVAAATPAAVPAAVSPPLAPKAGKTMVASQPAARSPQKAVAEPSPVAAQKVEKPVVPLVAVDKDTAMVKPVKIAPKKLPLASKAKPKLSPEAVAKKAAMLAKRIATPVAPKAHVRAKPIKGIMLQPPRERGLDPAFQDPPLQAIDRRCRAGELARECEARTR